MKTYTFISIITCISILLAGCVGRDLAKKTDKKIVLEEVVSESPVEETTVDPLIVETVTDSSTEEEVSHSFPEGMADNEPSIVDVDFDLYLGEDFDELSLEEEALNNEELVTETSNEATDLQNEDVDTKSTVDSAKTNSAKIDFVKIDSDKTAVTPAIYEIIANSDTIKGHRGDSLNVTFILMDSLNIVGLWVNPQTGKEETKMEAHGETFYMQPGFTSTRDTTAGTLTIKGILGDDESLPITGEVPWGSTFLLILSCIGILGLVSKFPLKLW